MVYTYFEFVRYPIMYKRKYRCILFDNRPLYFEGSNEMLSDFEIKRGIVTIAEVMLEMIFFGGGGSSYEIIFIQFIYLIK